MVVQSVCIPLGPDALCCLRECFVDGDGGASSQAYMSCTRWSTQNDQGAYNIIQPAVYPRKNNGGERP